VTTRPRISVAAFLVAALFVSACAAPPVAPAFDDLQVASSGHDDGGEFCADFALTPTQVRTFLSRAVVVDAMTLHDRYDRLPCWVRGSAHDARGLWHWEIRAGGTVRLESPTGDVTLLACDACDELLGGRKR
jgi:hypothetical protein